MSTAEFPSDVLIRGQLRANELVPTNIKLARSNLAQEVTKAYPIPLWDARVHDDPTSHLSASPGTSDDLGIFGTTYGTDSVFLETGDLGGQTGVDQFARFLVPVPVEYDDGATIQFRIRAQISSTNAADTSATLDIEAFNRDQEGGVSGSDLVTTAGQDMNSTSWADFTFTVDGANVDPATLLDVRVKININDGSANAVKGKIGDIALEMDVRG